MNATRRGLPLLLFFLLAMGCELIFDLDDYPYIPVIYVTEEPEGEPNLRFTELMVATSDVDDVFGLGERGEYIEILNVGGGLADPRNITIRLEPSGPGSAMQIAVMRPTTQEEVTAYTSLRGIGEGDRFVFVRGSTERVPVARLVGLGRSYDFSAGGFGPGIPNTGDWLITLNYFDGEQIFMFDQLRLRDGEMVDIDDVSSVGPSVIPDQSMALRPEFESSEAERGPSAWCLVQDEISDGAMGAPGRPAMSCD